MAFSWWFSASPFWQQSLSPTLFLCTTLRYVKSREVVGIFIFAGIFQKVAEMSLKKVVDRGYIFIFFIFIVFLLTNIFNFFKKSLKFQMFKFLSLIFVRFTKSHWKSRWFSKNFCRNFPTFRRPTTSLVVINLSMKGVKY